MKTPQTKWTALLRSGGGFGILWMVLLSSIPPAQVPSRETGWLKQLQSPDLDFHYTQTTLLRWIPATDKVQILEDTVDAPSKMD